MTEITRQTPPIQQPTVNSPDMQSCDMTRIYKSYWETGGLSSRSAGVLPSGNDPHRSSALRNCSKSTREALSQYRKTGDIRFLSTIITGIIAPYVESGLQARLNDAGDDLRLFEDLGIDSLTMMEIGILIEDILPVSIGNEEMRQFQTLGTVRKFIECRLHGSFPDKSTAFLARPPA